MSHPAPPVEPVAREAVLAGGLAALLAAALAWFGPPGPDFAAHLYQSGLFHEHGFAVWNNFWYAGRYSFVTYSLLYYPLAALLGIKLLAVASIATAALAFAALVAREWGPVTRWSDRSFAVVWAGVILSGAFPFALGAALGLLALWALQAGGRRRFVLLTAFTLAASPLAFVLLAVVLAGVALSRKPPRTVIVTPLLTVVVVGAVELFLWRLFPSAGRFPFSALDFVAVCLFCLLGSAFTWHVPQARVLRWVFVVYLLACVTAYAVPSELGGNIARLRYAAVPLAILILSLRQWRPLPVSVLVLAFATSWNLTPLASSFAHAASDPSRHAAYWQPAIGFLQAHLTPSYRVEAVDTVGHWPAAYLPAAGIPIARGWFRQNDFPRNEILYDELGSQAYRVWLRSLGVRYVVLSDAPPDYSARKESALLRSGRSGLTVVFHSRNTTVYEVPRSRPLVTGPGSARVIRLGRASVTMRVGAPGRYRVAVSYSPYWQARSACVDKRRDGMLGVNVTRVGIVRLEINLDASHALAALGGHDSRHCVS